MTYVLLALLNGISLAAVFTVLVRTRGRKHAVPLHTAMLLAAPLFYVGFACRAGSWPGLVMEAGGVTMFGGVALLALMRRSPALLAAGWVLHPVWDIVLHTAGLGAAYTPEGWVVACIGFDWLLAAFIAAGWAGIPRRTGRAHTRVGKDGGIDQTPALSA